MLHLCRPSAYAALAGAEPARPEAGDAVARAGRHARGFSRGRSFALATAARRRCRSALEPHGYSTDPKNGRIRATRVFLWPEQLGLSIGRVLASPGATRVSSAGVPAA